MDKSQEMCNTAYSSSDCDDGLPLPDALVTSVDSPSTGTAKIARPADRPMHFEEALELTSFGRFNYYLIVVSGLILTTVLLETLGISYVIPVSECDMHLSTRDKGILSAVGFAGIISSSHLWGFLADTQGRRKVILPTLLVSFACTLASSVTTNFWLFVVFRYLNGFFVSGSSATIYAYLGEFHTQRQRSRAIMGASVIFGITCIMLPVLAWLVINQDWQLDIPYLNVTYKPWRLFLVVCGLPSLICALALIPVPESPKFVLAQGQQAETIRILQRIRRYNVSAERAASEPLHIASIIEEPESVERRARNAADRQSSGAVMHLLKSMWLQTAPLFRSPNLKRTFIACSMQFGIYVTSNGMYMWFPEILNRAVDFMERHPGEPMGLCQILAVTKINFTAEMALAEGAIKVCTTELEIATYEHSIILELLYALGFALIGLIINRIGKFPILFGVLFTCGVSGIAAVFVQVPMLAIYLYVVLLLCGLSVPVVNAATVDLYPTNSRAMAICITLMMGRLGSVAGANIVGLLLDNYCQLAFSMTGTILIVCGFLAMFIPNIRERVPIRPPHGPMECRHSIC